MNVTELVATAVRNYENIEPATIPEEMTPETAATIIPNPLGFALGWVLADAIVANRYHGSAIGA